MISVEFKMFIDRPEVLKRIDRKRSRVLAKTGGFGRQTMRRQMRPGGKKRKQSQPGEAPRRHANPLLYKLLFFGIDEEDDSLVIGPQLISSSRRVRADGGMTIPELLNEGGSATIRLGGVTRDAEYLPRPFTEPVRPTVEQFFVRQIEETPL